MAAGEPVGRGIWRVPDGFGARAELLRAEETSGRAGVTKRIVRLGGRLELPASTLALAGECILEFENAVGSKLRVHLKGGAIPDLVALGRSFWNAES